MLNSMFVSDRLLGLLSSGRLANIPLQNAAWCSKHGENRCAFDNGGRMDLRRHVQSTCERHMVFLLGVECMKNRRRMDTNGS